MAEQVSNLLQYSSEAAPRNISGKLAVGFIVVTIPLAVSVFWVDYDRRPLIFLAAVACASMAMFSGLWSVRRKRAIRLRDAWIVTSIAILEVASDALVHPRYGPSARVLCASNMRQILLAALLYADDHNGKFPPSLDVLPATEDISAEPFVCPASSLMPAPGATAADQAASMRADLAHHLSYIYLGRGLSNDPNVPLQIILYEPLSDHGGTGINVGYSDGSVAWMNRKDAIAAINAALSAAATRPTTLPFIKSNNQGEQR